MYTCTRAMQPEYRISIGATLISIIFPTIARSTSRVLPVSPFPPIFFRPFSKRNGISANRFVIYGESLASRLSIEAPPPRQLATRPSVLHILPPLPSSSRSRTLYPSFSLLSRFPLSLFPSFARISRIAIFADDGYYR